MATLHIRGVPEKLHKRIGQLATAHNRSLSKEVITLLDRAMQEEEIRHSQVVLLEDIRRRRLRRRPNPKAPDSMILLREDRMR